MTLAESERMFNVNHVYADVNWADSSAFAAELEIRWKHWYLDYAHQLLANGHAGFAVVGVTMPVLEGLTTYWRPPPPARTKRTVNGSSSLSARC